MSEENEEGVGSGFMVGVCLGLIVIAFGIVGFILMDNFTHRQVKKAWYKVVAFYEQVDGPDFQALDCISPPPSEREEWEEAYKALQYRVIKVGKEYYLLGEYNDYRKAYVYGSGTGWDRKIGYVDSNYEKVKCNYPEAKMEKRRW